MTAWEQELTLGVAFIDAEHQALIDILTELGTAEGAQDRIRLGNLLPRLVSETRDHFANEEREMHERAYPMMSSHVAQHGRFMAELEDLRVRHNGGEVVVVAQVVTFIQTWFARHVDLSDRPLAEWLLCAEERSFAVPTRRRRWSHGRATMPCGSTRV